jgi:hypothetical protein
MIHGTPACLTKSALPQREDKMKCRELGVAIFLSMGNEFCNHCVAIGDSATSGRDKALDLNELRIPKKLQKSLGLH